MIDTAGVGMDEAGPTHDNLFPMNKILFWLLGGVLKLPNSSHRHHLEYVACHVSMNNSRHIIEDVEWCKDGLSLPMSVSRQRALA